MTAPSRRRWPAVTALLLLSVAGCGSSGPSPEEYVGQVNGICSANAEALSGDNLPQDPAQLGDALQQTVDAVRTTIGQIDAVERPEADAERIQAEFIDPVTRQVDQAQEALPEVRQALEAQDLQRLSELSMQVDTGQNEQVQEFLTSYGLNDCAVLTGAQ